MRYSTLSARAKISGTAHDDTPSREKFESYDDLQEIELNSPFPPGRTAAMDSPAARHAPGTPSGSGSDTSSVADDPVVLVTHL